MSSSPLTSKRISLPLLPPASSLYLSISPSQRTPSGTTHLSHTRSLPGPWEKCTHGSVDRPKNGTIFSIQSLYRLNEVAPYCPFCTAFAVFSPSLSSFFLFSLAFPFRLGFSLSSLRLSPLFSHSRCVVNLSSCWKLVASSWCNLRFGWWDRRGVRSSLRSIAPLDRPWWGSGYLPIGRGISELFEGLRALLL